MPQTTTTPSSYPSYVYTNENNRIGLPPAKGEKKVRFEERRNLFSVTVFVT